MLTAVITVSGAAAVDNSPIAYGQITEETVQAEKVAIAETSIERIVRERFKDKPVMIEIARCESQFLQFNKDGQVIKNPTSSAKGIFQIMESLHKEPAARLGFDILTVEGNLGYADYLHQKEGTRPWNASANCWNKTLAYGN